MKRFILEIYEPDSATTVLAHIETTAAIPIAAGETLRTGLLVTDRPDSTLRITRIEQVLWKAPEGWAQKRMVFTEPSA